MHTDTTYAGIWRRFWALVIAWRVCWESIEHIADLATTGRLMQNSKREDER